VLKKKINLLQKCQFSTSSRFQRRNIERVGPKLNQTKMSQFKINNNMVNVDVYPDYWKLPCNYFEVVLIDKKQSNLESNQQSDE